MASTSIATAVTYEEGLVCEKAMNQWEALDGVLQRYEPALYRMALRHLRNPADAEDALQDALLSALRHVGDFQGRSQISTWLTKIVINAARMQFRRHHRHESVSLDQSTHDEGMTYAERLVSGGASPEEACRQRELYRLLDDLLERLPVSQRTVFRLRELDGLSTRETAQTLSISQGTVKTQLARARHKLGSWFKQYPGVPHPKSRARKTLTRRKALAAVAG